VPSARNAMVCDHYAQLGFKPLNANSNSELSTKWTLDLEKHEPFVVEMQVEHRQTGVNIAV